MRNVGFVRSWMSWCAGVCLVVGACSTEEGDGDAEGSGGTDAVGGSTGGTAGKGQAGCGVAASGGTCVRPTGGTGGRPGGDGGGGQGGGCDEEVVNRLIKRTLAEYCEYNACPQTLDEARREFSECRAWEYAEETTGCGYTTLSFHDEYSARGYVFEGSALVGAYSGSDALAPPCDAAGEFGGIYPPTCPGADKCHICDHEIGAGGQGPLCDFDGGAGGEGGWGGQGGR